MPRRAFLVGVLCMSAGACHIVFGFDEVVVEENGGGAGTGGDSGGEGGNPIATVGGFGGGGALTTTTTAGGDGGGGSPSTDCVVQNLGLTGLCPGNQKCTVLNPSTGEVGCGSAGSNQIWHVCVDDSDCEDGDFCDLNGKVCKPFCRNAADCDAFDGECVAAKQAGTSSPDIPNGVKTCLSMCSPLDGSPCPAAQNVTCAYLGSNQFDCASSLDFNLNSVCEAQADCALTLGCINDIVLSYCVQWCSPIGSSHPNCATTNCTALSQQVTYDGMIIGTCY